MQEESFAIDTTTSNSTAFWQPKFIWKNTELDGVLPVSNFS